MSANSKIEWTDHTWNPVRGCSRISRGCENCYAERIAARFSGQHLAAGPAMAFWEGQPFHGFAKRTESGPRWTGRVELVESKITEPFYRPSWRGKRVFVNSMSDLFHEALPNEAINRVFAMMALCPDVTFQVLTKRPERMGRYIAARSGAWLTPYMGQALEMLAGRAFARDPEGWPLPNVWLGVSIEDQKTADERIPHLLQTPAAVRFLSYEPALGPVDLTNRQGLYFDALYGVNHRQTKIDWVIAGGESGPGARPAHPDWFRQVRDQCGLAGVPFFFKQWGEYSPEGPITTPQKTVCAADGWSGCFGLDALAKHAKEAHASEISGPPFQLMYRVGKKTAGRLLDGREHDEFPNDHR